MFLLAGVPQSLQAQTRSVTGTVTDARTMAPISGAQIVIRDSGIGAITNPQGRYLLTNVPEGRL
ncbi:MAG TPA: carboxypeptidase-like regulatory domain-containing protein, partial [Longimicrobiales bacterium]|nr:carboxypeptidase-like regulatory domain-containing protein [Longimicrobiales bacterium]